MTVGGISALFFLAVTIGMFGALVLELATVLKAKPEIKPKPEPGHTWVPVILLTGETVNHICAVPGCYAERVEI